MTHVKVNVSSGEKTVVGSYGIIDRSRLTVTPIQMRIALHRLGELDTVNYIADQHPEAKIAWEYATSIDRNNSFVELLASDHYTSGEIDGFFEEALNVSI